MTVDEFYHQTINELRNNGQVGTNYAYKNSYDTLKNFNNGNKLNYTFSYIDVEFCHKFEDWMRKKGNKDTTISYQFRTLRAAYNRAILKRVVNWEPLLYLTSNKFRICAMMFCFQSHNISLKCSSSFINTF